MSRYLGLETLKPDARKTLRGLLGLGALGVGARTGIKALVKSGPSEVAHGVSIVKGGVPKNPEITYFTREQLKGMSESAASFPWETLLTGGLLVAGLLALRQMIAPPNIVSLKHYRELRKKQTSWPYSHYKSPTFGGALKEEILSTGKKILGKLK